MIWDWEDASISNEMWSEMEKNVAELTQKVAELETKLAEHRHGYRWELWA